jgi:hypothetical protein
MAAEQASGEDILLSEATSTAASSPGGPRPATPRVYSCRMVAGRARGCPARFADRPVAKNSASIKLGCCLKEGQAARDCCTRASCRSECARPAKHLLSEGDRRKALRGAFATCPSSQVDNQRVLLVDDVMTTGATLDASRKGVAQRWWGSCFTAGRAVVRNPHRVDS